MTFRRLALVFAVAMLSSAVMAQEDCGEGLIPAEGTEFIDSFQTYSVTMPELFDGEGSGDKVQSRDLARKTPFYKKGIVGKLVNYFDKADDPKPLDKLDFSIIGGPFYNKTAGLGIGLCASGLYHLQPTNAVLPQSSFSLTAQATTKGMFKLNVRGYNYLPNDLFRSDFEIDLTTFRTEFWGLGYKFCDDNQFNSSFTRNQIRANANFLVHLAGKLYMGPSLYYSLFYADKRDEMANYLIGDGPHRTSTLGIGATVRFDTRDFALDPKRGVFFNFEQRVQPKCFGNHSTFATSELQVSAFTPLWKGCVLGGELHSLINCGDDVPWTEFAKMGGVYRMRGYYEARYTDRNIIEAQLEFRQHIKGRNGIVAWIGFANVFRDTHTWRFSHTLPNGGLGYRWRFKPGVNIRLDLGFTRNGLGFIFAINEAF